MGILEERLNADTFNMVQETVEFAASPQGKASLKVWVAIIAATVVKVRTSARLGPVQTSATIIVAVTAAWAMGDDAQKYTGLSAPAAAAIVALSAEGIMRWLLIFIDDPREALRLWNLWRGR